MKVLAAHSVCGRQMPVTMLLRSVEPVKNWMRMVTRIEAIGGSAECKVADLSDAGSIKDLFQSIDSLDGSLNFVVYNAGNSFRHTTADAHNSFLRRPGASAASAGLSPDGQRLIGWL